MDNKMISAIVILVIASVIELIGAYGLVSGWIDTNPHAVIMTISAIAFAWIGILTASL